MYRSGIVGLYTAYLLLERGIDASRIRIIAKHVPGDMSHEYASPYAGATAACVKDKDEKIQFYSKFTFENLGKIQKQLGGPECGLDWTINSEFWQEKPDDIRLKAFQSYVPYYEVLPKSQCPKDTVFGIKYKTWVFHAPVFTENLSNYVKSKGVKVIVKELKHIKEAAVDEKTIIFNCTGLGSRSLKGVEDKDVIPTRGQVLVVKAPHINEVRLCWRKTSATYMIKRPGKGDELILGGFYQPNNYNRDIIGSETRDILKRTSEAFPVLLKPGQTVDDIEILRIVSAFRPGRTKGVRIEKQMYGKNIAVHNYGAAGTGFAQGLGMAESAIRLVYKESRL